VNFDIEPVGAEAVDTENLDRTSGEPDIDETRHRGAGDGRLITDADLFVVINV
jgi:hypothetical protein